MMLTQLNLLRLQRKLRGLRIVRAGRSVGPCILMDFSATGKEPGPRVAGPGLLVELAAWDLRQGDRTVASSSSWRRLISSVIPRLNGTCITGASIGQRGVKLAFEKGFELTVATRTPSQLGSDWNLDQWILFGIHSATIYQPARGRIASALTTPPLGTS